MPLGLAQSGLYRLTGIIFLAAFVGVTAWGGNVWALDTGRAPPIWLSNGAILAFLLVSKPQKWRQYLLAGFMANIVGDVAAGTTVDGAIALSSLNIFEVLAAGLPLQQLLKEAPDLSQPKVFSKFSFFAIALAPFITPILAAASLSFTADIDFLLTFSQYFLAHSLGLAIVTPFFLLFLQRDAANNENWVNIFVALVGSLAVIGAVFFQTSYPFLFFIPPVLILVASTQGLPSILLCMPFFTAIALSATIMGHGPFALAKTSSLSEKIALSQIFIICNFIMLAYVANLATERRRVMQKLLNFSVLDGLTGIANRRSFDEVLEKEWRRALRDKKPLSLLLLDIDHFKLYNDSYGHLEGDQCIIRFANSLAPFANRPGDLKARYGGEEFAVILAGCAERNAKTIAEHIRVSIEAMKIPHKGNKACGGIVTSSIGVATLFPWEVLSEFGQKKLIEDADKALYEAKRTGRNKVVSLNTIESDVLPSAGVNEEARIPIVESYVKKAAQYKNELDQIAYLAATLLNSPIGLVSMVGRDEQIFVGRYGLDSSGSSRDVSFCAHTLNGDMPMVVTDATADNRFKNNALVTGGLGIRFYVGAPLMTSADGTHLGALCVIDQESKAAPNVEHLKLLNILAGLAVKCMEGELRPEDINSSAAEKRHLTNKNPE